MGPRASQVYWNVRKSSLTLVFLTPLVFPFPNGQISMKLWRNTLWNMLGLIVPSIIALPAMGFMARILGVEEFGLFMLAFSLLGYASIFDGGMTRAVIHAVAINNGNLEKDRQVLGTATWTVLSLSILVGVLMFYFSENVIGWLNVSINASDEATQAFEYLALVVPPTLLGMVWFSYPEGRQQFAKLNIYKTISGSLVALLPALALYWEANLVNAILGLLLARILNLGLAFILCYSGLGGLFFSFKLQVLKTLLSFGSWITLSNIVSPLMVYADRFILSSTLGASRVAFYTAPAEAVARMGIVPGALAKVLFPFFSGNRGDTLRVASQAYKGLLLTSIVMVLPVFLLAEMILQLWLGEPYGQESANILRILLIGFLFNSLAQIPFARIQAHGKSKLTAMIHLAEFIPYMVILGGFVYFWGLHGAAIAWALRVAVDFVVLEHFSRKLERC